MRDYRPRSCLRVAQHHLDAPRFEVVDAHNHLGRWLSADGRWVVEDVGALLDTMARTRTRSIVNLDGRWGGELEANLDRYDRANHGRFATFCQLDWREARSRGFGERLAVSLERSVGSGARGVKVWKDLGLHVTDDRGDWLFADDERLAPVWQRAGELDVPVLIHSGDPVAFFEPVDPFNERLEELLANPAWSFADPRFPRFERLIEVLEATVAAHPATTFIGAHAVFPEDLRWVARMLDTYPNFNVDIAARVAELGRQPNAARRLMLDHPDRVLFGLDLFPPAAEDYALCWRFLETADEHFAYSNDEVPPQGRWAISGLSLPDHVLEAVYATNALRLVPGLA
ncbi:MAG: amidohydrolase family protein [Actinomycetota bacterium]